MWYRKAMDLNQLNLQFPEEREQVIEKVEDENIEKSVGGLFDKMKAGEEYTSPSGAIKVNPRIEIPPIRNEDIDGSFSGITVDYGQMKYEISGATNYIQSFINLTKTLERYIPSDTRFVAEMENFKSFFESLDNFLGEEIQKEQAKLPQMKQYFPGNTPEEQKEIQRHNREVIEFFNTYDSPVLHEEISHEVNDKFARMTKLINEMAPKIMSRDGKTEWLNLMAKHGIGANFLPANLRSQYLKIMQDIYSGY